MTCAKTLHFDLNEPERAEELFEMVLDADPQNVDAFFHLALQVKALLRRF